MNRLMSCLYVDDRKPSHPESDPVVPIITFIIRTPPGYDPIHLHDQVRIDLTGRRHSYTNDPTHIACPSLKRPVASASRHPDTQLLTFFRSHPRNTPVPPIGDR